MGYDVKLAKTCLKKAGNDLDKALDIIKEGEISGVAGSKKYDLEDTDNSLVKLMLYLSESLENAISRCLICQNELEAPSIKLRTCSREMCEYIFEESFHGSLLTELKHFTLESHLDISIASKAIFSTRNQDIFEPFPTFFLKAHELRGKRGNLDEIKKAQIAGVDVNKAKKTNAGNKDMIKMMEIFSLIPGLRELVNDVETDEALKKKLSTYY